MENSIKRITKREETQMVPRYLTDQTGLAVVDVTWGQIQPIQVSEEVQTVGELEVMDHLGKGLPVVDVRAPDTYFDKSIPGTIKIPHTEIVDRMHELDRTKETIFFCNGPQCLQSPSAIRKLLDAGYPAEKILYYRGGMHDWVTLGLPVTKGNE